MSSGGTPYIGSKIRLISKAKIRYEGFLYTIDTDESTVTLAKVKSFGTEDRVADNIVPERNEIYEYIVFRGSDIDDLHVSEGPKSRAQVAQDPAIVQTGSAQPNMYQQQLPMQMGTPFPHQSYGPFGGMHTFGYPMGFRPPSSMSLSSVIGQSNINERTQRSSPFERSYRPSPSPPTSNTIGSRYSFKDQRDKRSMSPGESHSFKSDYNKEKESSDRVEASQLKKGQKYEMHSKEDEKQRERYTQRASYQSNSRRPIKENEHKTPHQPKDVLKENDGPTNKDKSKERNQAQNSGMSAKKAVESKNMSFGNKMKHAESKASKDLKEKEKPRISNSGYKKEMTQKDGSQEEVHEQRINSTGFERGRGRGRGNRRGKQRGRGSFNRTKFDKDFDFESANAKFNKEEVEKELLTTLKKNLTVKEDDEDVIVEKDSDGDNETDERENVNGDEYFYDKSKSFFDNISCDSLKQKEEILTRRKERTMNVETFGVVSWNYRGRGRPYRGRGGRGGRGRGNSRGQYNRRGGSRGENRAWVDYEFDFEAAGLRQGMNGNKKGGS